MPVESTEVAYPSELEIPGGCLLSMHPKVTYRRANGFYYANQIYSNFFLRQRSLVKIIFCNPRSQRNKSRQESFD